MSSKSQIEYSESIGLNCWTGTGEALVENNLIREEMLPGKPGRNKYTITEGKRNTTSYVQVQRIGKNRYEVRKGVADEERNQRWNAEMKKMKVERKVEQLAAVMEKGAESLRDEMMTWLSLLYDGLNNGKMGYSFDGPHALVMRECVISAARSLLSANIRSDRRVIETKIRECYEDASLPVPDKYQQKLRLVS